MGKIFKVPSQHFLTHLLRRKIFHLSGEDKLISNFSCNEADREGWPPDRPLIPARPDLIVFEELNASTQVEILEFEQDVMTAQYHNYRKEHANQLNEYAKKLSQKIDIINMLKDRVLDLETTVTNLNNSEAQITDKLEDSKQN